MYVCMPFILSNIQDPTSNLESTHSRLQKSYKNIYATNYYTVTFLRCDNTENDLCFVLLFFLLSSSVVLSEDPVCKYGNVRFTHHFATMPMDHDPYLNLIYMPRLFLV